MYLFLGLHILRANVNSSLNDPLQTAINDSGNNYDDDDGGADDDGGDDIAGAVDAYADLEEPLG